MADISAEAVRALRTKTDLPLMDCKRALTEANGDENLAIEILRKAGLKAATKRADNATDEGKFFFLSQPDGSTAALVEVLCESAPVAKSDVINRIREKIVVGRIWKVTGPVGGYVHHDGKTAALFQASGTGAKLDLLKDVAMQVAAMQPKVTLSSELDSALIAAERDRLMEEGKASGKPVNIVEKMVEGRLKTFYRDNGVLVDQLFVKDDTKTVSKALSDAGFEAVGFKRVVLGKA